MNNNDNLPVALSIDRVEEKFNKAKDRSWARRYFVSSKRSNAKVGT